MNILEGWILKLRELLPPHDHNKRGGVGEVVKGEISQTSMG